MLVFDEACNLVCRATGARIILRGEVNHFMINEKADGTREGRPMKPLPIKTKSVGEFCIPAIGSYEREELDMVKYITRGRKVKEKEYIMEKRNIKKKLIGYKVLTKTDILEFLQMEEIDDYNVLEKFKDILPKCDEIEYSFRGEDKKLYFSINGDEKHIEFRVYTDKNKKIFKPDNDGLVLLYHPSIPKEYTDKFTDITLDIKETLEIKETEEEERINKEIKGGNLDEKTKKEKKDILYKLYQLFI